MTSRTITVLGYGIIAAVAAACQRHARRDDTRLAPFGDLVRWVLATRSGRIGLFAAWAWLGLHFFG